MSARPGFIYAPARLQDAGDAADAAAVTAAQVLDHHAALHDRLAHPPVAIQSFIEQWAEESAGQVWADPEMIFYPHHVVGAPAAPGWAARFCVGLARSLFIARTYQVTADMCDVAEAMYEETARKATSVGEPDLPAEAGFLWLDKPYRRVERAEVARFRALNWEVLALGAVRVTWWADWRSDIVGREIYETDEHARVLRQLGPLILASTVTARFGQPFAPTGEWSSPLHYAHALWLLMGTEIAAAQAAPVDRHVRRRALRSIRQNEVSVIILRRGRSDGGHGHRDVDWSCRWLVRGFWRHLGDYSSKAPAHEGRPGADGCAVCGVRVTWVRPYVKGPEGRPLKASRQLYRLSR